MKPDAFVASPPGAVRRGVVAVVVEADAADPDNTAVLESLRARHGDALMLVPAAVADPTATIERVAATLRPRTIVVCGGDALVTAAATVCHRHDLELAVVPRGSDSIARSLGIPRERAAACRAIRRGGVHSIDVLAASGALVLGRVVMGRFSELERRFHAPKPFWGRVWSVLGELFGSRIRFELDVDGVIHRVRATSVIVANAGEIGYAGLRWSPGIDPSDRRFDIVVVHSSTVFDYAALMWSWITDRPRARQLTHLRAHHRLRVRTRRPVAVNTDGRHEARAELDVELSDDRLRVVMPEPPLAAVGTPLLVQTPPVPTLLAAVG